MAEDNNTPVGPPPPGVTSNFDNPVDQYATTVGWCTAAMALTVPFVCMKLFTKACILKQLQREDYLLVMAEVSFAAWCTLLLVDRNHNAHVWDTRLSEMTHDLQFNNIIIIAYSPTMLQVKAAAILQLQRIFVVQSFNRVWWTCQVLLWLSSIYYTICFFTSIFQCTPRVKIWRPEVEGSCLDLNAILGSSAVWNILANLGILLIPVIALRGSKLPRRKQTIVYSVFCVSLLSMIACVGRVAYLIVLLLTDDDTWNMEGQAMWAVAEFATMIIAAAMPSAPAFCRFCYLRYKSSASENSASAENPEFGVFQPAMRQNEPRTRYPLTTSDEETGSIVTMGPAATVNPPPMTSKSALSSILLPPPIVPPKPDGYISPCASTAQSQRRGQKARAPPMSPTTTRASMRDALESGSFLIIDEWSSEEMTEVRGDETEIEDTRSEFTRRSSGVLAAEPPLSVQPPLPVHEAGAQR